VHITARVAEVDVDGAFDDLTVMTRDVACEGRPTLLTHLTRPRLTTEGSKAPLETSAHAWEGRSSQQQTGAGRRVASVSVEPSNAASELIRSASASLSRSGSPPSVEMVLAALTDDFSYEDRRSGPSFPDADGESFARGVLSIWQTGADGQPSFEAETLAVRGERFAAIAFQTDYGNGMQSDYIQVVALDATLTLTQRQVDFDRDDIDGAIAELDRLHRESDAI